MDNGTGKSSGIMGKASVRTMDCEVAIRDHSRGPARAVPGQPEPARTGLDQQGSIRAGPARDHPAEYSTDDLTLWAGGPANASSGRQFRRAVNERYQIPWPLLAMFAAVTSPRRLCFAKLKLAQAIATLCMTHARFLLILRLTSQSDSDSSGVMRTGRLGR